MLLGGLVGLYLLSQYGLGNIPQLTWSEFLTHVLSTGRIRKIVVLPDADVALVYPLQGTHDSAGYSVGNKMHSRIYR